MPHDIFISYSRRDKDVVSQIVNELRATGRDCWMDTDPGRIPSGSPDFFEQIKEGIRESKVFLFVISESYLKSVPAKKELEIARELAKEHIVPVRFDNVALPPALLQADVIDWRVHEQKRKLLADLRKWSSRKSNQKVASASGIWQIDPEFIKQFDTPTYERLGRELESLRVLDLGSGNGSVAMSRLTRTGKPFKYLGIDCEKKSVDAGNSKFGKFGNNIFKVANLENSSCAEAVESGMRELGISDFNVINVTMVLLYLKNPVQVLKMARPFLAKRGVIVIRDIDDGLNAAFPDKDGRFSGAIELCNTHGTSGARKNGRQIYASLDKAGFSDIKLENLGVSTCGMKRKDREELFSFYFSSLINDLKSATINHPSNLSLRSDFEKYSRSIKTLHSRFLEDSFFFTLGLMLFTARG